VTNPRLVFLFQIGRRTTAAVLGLTIALAMTVVVTCSALGQSGVPAKAISSASGYPNVEANSRQQSIAPGIVIFTDLGPPGDLYNCCIGWTAAGSGALGTSFTAGNWFVISGSGSFEITQIDLGLVYVSGTNLFDVSIWTDNGGVPGTQVPNACFFAVPGVPSGNLLAINGISGSSQVSLTAGQPYFMVIGPEYLTDTTLGSWNWNNQGVSTLDVYSNDGGSTWSPSGTGPLGAMDIQGNAAPGYSVIYNFTNGLDGATPISALTIDKAGNFYGTAGTGGSTGNGTVFKLTRSGSNWTLTSLYSFQGGTDGSKPSSRLVFGPDGSLYGTTIYGGGSGCGGSGCGTVFNLKPGSSSTWKETVLYKFSGGSDGALPTLGELIFDKAGNIYGTTWQGGTYNTGTVYELTPSGGTWTLSVLYTFTGGSDGGNPYAGVIFDKAGSLYGTAITGGIGGGTIYQLTNSGSGWTERVLYDFTSGPGGVFPLAGLIFDNSGNLFGASSWGFSGHGGAVFELSPSGGSWIFSALYTFPPGEGPFDSLIQDSAGSLYGTKDAGNVFELTPAGLVWVYTDFHDFSNYCNDGEYPYGGLVMDAKGNLYGTTTEGGSNGYGVIFEITR
jgi:uncharacterized repeat protein (TIGR03803 family)